MGEMAQSVPVSKHLCVWAGVQLGIKAYCRRWPCDIHYTLSRLLGNLTDIAWSSFFSFRSIFCGRAPEDNSARLTAAQPPWIRKRKLPRHDIGLWPLYFLFTVNSTHKRLHKVLWLWLFPEWVAEDGAGYFGRTALGPLYWDATGLFDHSKSEEFAESTLDSCVPLEQLFTTQDGQAQACTRPCTCTRVRTHEAHDTRNSENIS